MKSSLYLLSLAMLTGVLSLTACKKLIEIPSPKNQLTTDKVFADSSSATAAMVNVYSLFNRTIDINYNTAMGCYTDELQYSGTTPGIIEYGQASVPPSNVMALNFWQSSYFAIYSCNDIIKQVNNPSLPLKLQQQFQGEAKFLRAFAYLNLVNTYGPVPLILGTDVNNNAIAARSDSATVYKQITQDLLDAKIILSKQDPSGVRVRANQYAVDALLARLYLWQKDWSNASSYADSVLSSGQFTPLPNTASVFKSRSNETILAFFTQFGYISDAPNLIPSSGAPQYFYSKQQLNSFEAGDHRKTDWILPTRVDTSVFYSPYKYQNQITNTSTPEYLIALRAGEQYLIRAEANAQLNNISGAVADLNVIRNRAGLGNYAGTNDQKTLIAAIQHERQVELFSEWGNRYADLRRSGRLNKVNQSIKATWKSTSIFLPIPQSEINTDPNLKQNQGY
jgi:hypothetical protein